MVGRHPYPCAGHGVATVQSATAGQDPRIQLIGLEKMNSIVGRDVSPENKIEWVPAELSFPMHWSIIGSRLAGTVALFIGAVWIAFFIDDLFKAVKPPLVLPELAMMALVTAPGLIVLIYGFSQYVYREETIVDRTGVSWRRRGLSGSREWREPVANYRGVLKTHQYWQRGPEDASRRASHMIYFIRLTHSDPGKDIVLYRAESDMLVPPTDWAEKWQRYAELFQLPVLEETASGVRASDARDMDTPLVDKIRDGRLKPATIDPDNAALGRMAKLTREDELWIITCYPVWNAWKSIAGVLFLSLALFGAYAFDLIDPQLLRYFLWVVPICVLAVALSIRHHLSHPEQLAVDKRNVYYRYFKKPAGWVSDDIPLPSIRDISVKSNPMHFRSPADIVVAAKNRSIRFGWWLPRKTKLRIERVVLSLIADALNGRR